MAETSDPSTPPSSTSTTSGGAGSSGAPGTPGRDDAVPPDTEAGATTAASTEPIGDELKDADEVSVDDAASTEDDDGEGRTKNTIINIR